MRRSNNNNPNAKANLACSGTANKATQIGEENQPVKQPRTDSKWKKVKTRLEDTIAAWGKKTLPPVGILMVLRCVLYFMATHVMALTPACCATAHVLRMGDKTVIDHVKDYVDQPEPQPMPRHKKKKKAGRGSLVFKDKYKDKFMVLKNPHLKHIVRYVHLQNEMHVAMTSVRGLRHYLLAVTGIGFTRRVIEYALHVRLGYHYITPVKNRLALTPQRKRLLREFILKYDAALKLQAKGTHVIVYMDESYVHTNHAPSRVWMKCDKDGKQAEPINRPHGKGKLTVILHAISREDQYQGCGRRHLSVGLRETTGGQARDHCL